jgi:hypothetical protein
MTLCIPVKTLEDNYYGIVQPCILEQVRTFFSNHPEPSRVGPEVTTYHIKLLTKIATHALKGDVQNSDRKWPAGLVEVVLLYCEEGIRRIESRQYENECFQLTPKSIQNMHSHLYAHSAGLRRRLAEGADSLEKSKLLELAIKDCTQSIAVGWKTDEEHAAYQHGFRAEALYKLAQISKPPEKYLLLDDAVRDMNNCIQRLEGLGVGCVSSHYVFAGNFFYDLALAIPVPETKRNCLETAVKCACRGAEIMCEGEPERLAAVCSDVVMFASALLRFGENERIRNLAGKYCRLAINIISAGKADCKCRGLQWLRRMRACLRKFKPENQGLPVRREKGRREASRLQKQVHDELGLLGRA